METIAEATAPTTSVVKLVVCHGNYRAEFYGNGADLLEAAEAAAVQSTYSSGLFDRSSGLYEDRASYRAGLAQALQNGETYRDFGWCDFSRIA